MKLRTGLDRLAGRLLLVAGRAGRLLLLAGLAAGTACRPAEEPAPPPPAATPLSYSLSAEDLEMVLEVQGEIRRRETAAVEARRRLGEALASGIPVVAAATASTRPDDVLNELGVAPDRFAQAAARLRQLRVVQRQQPERASARRFREAHLARLRTTLAAAPPAEQPIHAATIAEIEAGIARDAAAFAAVAAELELLARYADRLEPGSG